MKTKRLIECALCGVLTASGIVTSILSLLSEGNVMWLCDCGSLLMLALIAYYALNGYRKPHGELLKCLLLFHAVLRLAGIAAAIPAGNTIGILSRSVGIGLTCYVAGRLLKVRENLILMIIATVFLAVELASDIAAGIAGIGVISPLIAWIDICTVYFLRFKEHKEAGLSDRTR